MSALKCLSSKMGVPSVTAPFTLVGGGRVNKGDEGKGIWLTDDFIDFYGREQ
jgi:hypothetical protein